MHPLNRSFKFALHVCDLDETACRAQNNFNESKGMVKLKGKWTNWHGTVCTDVLTDGHLLGISFV